MLACAMTDLRGGAPGARRPLVITGLAVVLLLTPALQAASLAGFRALNFAPDRPWNYLAYGLGAPYVALLLWRRHPRARFAAYVFLTHETFRGLHFRNWDAVGAAVAWILLLQLPAARRYAPSLRSAEIRGRIAGYLRRHTATECRRARRAIPRR